MFDIVIIGAGLAGLTCAYELAKAGRSVAVVDKQQFPHHKVCGEYLSAEVYNYLQRENIWPDTVNIPRIDKLSITDLKNTSLNSSLQSGGYGVSRYTLDHAIYNACLEKNVTFYLNETCLEIQKTNDYYECVLKSKKNIRSRLVIGAFGKRSELDRSLARTWKKNKTEYVGIKYHRTGDIKRDTVYLHYFPGGYCGVNAVEDNIVNVCYLVHQDYLKKHKTIHALEKNHLSKNNYLCEVLENTESLWPEALKIGAISFDTKGPAADEIPIIGDAAGMITPLCGNGMAMAIQTGHLLSSALRRNVQFSEAMIEYTTQWNNTYRTRLQIGRLVQDVMLNDGWQKRGLTKMFKMLPKSLSYVISKTHGRPL